MTFLTPDVKVVVSSWLGRQTVVCGNSASSRWQHWRKRGLIFHIISLTVFK